MKKVLVILGTVFILVGVVGAFATGKSLGFAMSYEELREKYKDQLQDSSATYTEYGDFDTVIIKGASAKINIEYTEKDEISVEYKAARPDYICNISYENGALRVEEKSKFFISLGWFMGGESEISVTLPDEYKDKGLGLVDILLTSGELNGDIPTSEKLSMHFTSGEAKNVTTNCETADIYITSGDIHLVNRGDTMKRITYGATSGSARLVGYIAEKSSYDITSGRIALEKVSGDIKVDMTSGDVEIEYIDIGGSISVDSTSGNISIALPYDSGIDLDFERISGNCQVTTPNGNNGDTTVHNFSDDTKTTIFGNGKGTTKVKIDVISGNSYITTAK